MTDNQSLQRVELEQPANLVLEAKTSQQARVEEVAEALMPAYQKASELRLTNKEGDALCEPFRDDQVEIRPHDGLLYIPHIHVSDRLIRVLGAGQWAMVRRREWIEGNRIYAEYVMKVRGCFVGESVGCMDYHPGNSKMNYSDALEGTRGECIRRIAAKDLGCGSQVWNPEYCRQWIAKYAEQAKGRWQRKGTGTSLLDTPTGTGTAKLPGSGTGPAPGERGSKSSPQATAASEEQRKRWIALLKPIETAALAYAYERGILNGPEEVAGDMMPGEPLELWPLEATPTTKKMADMILGKIQAVMDTGMHSNASEANVAPKKANSDDHREAAWYQFEMPWGKLKGTPLGELDKKYLFGLWANYEVETEYKGKPKKPETIESDQEFRDMLDEAGRYYQFEEPA